MSLNLSPTLPHKVRIDLKWHHIADHWCRDNLGPSYWVGCKDATWQSNWGGHEDNWGVVFTFKYDSDATMFALRWA